MRQINDFQASDRTEEQAMAEFERAARELLRLSGAGFLAKLKKGEFAPLENHPSARTVAELIPNSLIR